MSIVNLESRLNAIYDHLYANAKVRTPQAIANEVSKILHSLTYMEMTKLIKVEHHYNYSLSNLKAALSDNNFITEVSKSIRNSLVSFNKKNRLYLKTELIIELSDFDIAYTCLQLSEVEISSREKDVFGDAMEVFRSYWTKSHGGQFFTDQRITRLAVHMLQFDPLKGDDLVDICAGTGGFLLAGLSKLREQLQQSDDPIDKKIESIAPVVLKGLEIDEDVLKVGNTTLSSRAGKNVEFIQHADSINESNYAGFNGFVSNGSHMNVATNPPFGSKITIKDTSILASYQLAKAFNRDGDSINNKQLIPRSLDILFLEKNIKLLVPGKGKIAIILPYQILSGPQAKFIRKWLLKKLELIAIVDLPADTFQPHTGTKASLLVALRRVKDLDDTDLSHDRDVFMSKPKWIGHDRRGNPIYEKNLDGTVGSKILSDIEQVEQAFSEFLNKKVATTVHDNSFSIPATDIEQDLGLRLDAQYYKSHKPQHISSELTWQNSKEWKLIPLADAVEKIFFPGRFTRTYVDRSDESVPFLGGANITQFVLQTEKRISAFDTKIDQLSVKPGWILVTRSGSTGIVSTVPEAWDGYAISEHVIRIIPNNTVIPYEYLYAFLKTNYAKEVMKKGVYGSVIDEITPEYIGNILIPVPTNQSVLDSIVSTVKLSEKERNNALNHFQQGMDVINRTLFNK